MLSDGARRLAMLVRLNGVSRVPAMDAMLLSRRLARVNYRVYGFGVWGVGSGWPRV
jgi:hypothetical protein